MSTHPADSQTSAVLSEILNLANRILNEAFQCAISGNPAKATALAAVAHERLYQYQIQVEQVYRFGAVHRAVPQPPAAESAPVPGHPFHAPDGPQDCLKCQLLRENQSWMEASGQKLPLLADDERIPARCEDW